MRLSHTHHGDYQLASSSDTSHKFYKFFLSNFRKFCQVVRSSNNNNNQTLVAEHSRGLC